MTNMYIKIDRDKLIKDIEKRGKDVIISEWTTNALELEKNDKSILEIKKLFNELHESEKNYDRVLVHLNMIFDKISNTNIDKFLSSQFHIKK